MSCNILNSTVIVQLFGAVRHYFDHNQLCFRGVIFYLCNNLTVTAVKGVRVFRKIIIVYIVNGSEPKIIVRIIKSKCEKICVIRHGILIIRHSACQLAFSGCAALTVFAERNSGSVT